MEPYKTTTLLYNSTVSKFVTKIWIEVNNLSSAQYSVNKNIRLKTSMLRSNLCDYSDAYIVLKGTTTVEGDDNDKSRNKTINVKNNAPFPWYASKINNTFIDNTEDLDMSMYNLLEYSEIILWQGVCGIIIEIK